MLSKVVSKLDQRDDSVWFVMTQTNASDATKRGYIFEVLVHRFFARGGTAVLRRLSPGGTAAERAGQSIVFPPRQQHVFSRLGAPAAQHECTTCIKKTPNFTVQHVYVTQGFSLPFRQSHQPSVSKLGASVARAKVIVLLQARDAATKVMTAVLMPLLRNLRVPLRHHDLARPSTLMH